MRRYLFLILRGIGRRHSASHSEQGVWFVYGGSGHGKTSFVLLLIKQLSQFDNVLFVSYEEGGKSTALQDGIRRFGLLEANRKVSVCVKSAKELEVRLSTGRSPNIVVIDSLDMSEFKRAEQVKKLADRFKNKLFIFTGWAKGDAPAKRIGEEALYMANQKIYVKGYRAISRGRSTGERGFFTVWEERARVFWEGR